MTQQQASQLANAVALYVRTAGETIPRVDPELDAQLDREFAALATASRPQERRLAVQRAPTWQPIETAPCDEWVLVYSIQYYGADLPSVCAGRLDGHGWEEPNGRGIRPTHWMPLPEAPHD